MKSTSCRFKRFLVLALTAAVGVSIPGCVQPEEPVSETRMSEAPVPTEKPAPVEIVVSGAGDCTLGTDESFGGSTLPDEVKRQEGDYSYFFRNVRSIFEEDDLTFVNLEGTLTVRGSRADKKYAFRGDPDYVNILTEGSVEAVTLANNHSLDYGQVSLEDTKAALDQAGIVWCENSSTAVVEKKGVKLGLISLNDLPGNAGELLPGAIESVREKGAELILVGIHWGIEGDHIPMESQTELAHQAIDLGAHLVLGHHPHVLQGIEEYRGRYIVYSLGNFCFGGNQNPSDKDSMIFRQTFTVEDGQVLSDSRYEIIPCSISSVGARNNYQPTPLSGAERERVERKLRQYSGSLGELELQFRQG